MPKDIVHWLVADRTADKLHGTPWAAHLAERRHLLRVAAVFHDALYYLRGEWPAAIRPLSDRLHGSKGQDTFEILRLQLGHIRSGTHGGTPPSDAVAALAGLASHIFADAQVHPMVFYYTGRYGDPDPWKRTKAIQRHRALETVMDVSAAGGLNGVTRYSLQDMVSAAGLKDTAGLIRAFPLEGLARVALRDAVAGQDLARAYASAFKTYVFMQGLYRLETLSRSLESIRPILPNGVQELVALFYAPQLLPETERFTSPLGYRHPVIGRQESFVLQDAIEAAAETTAQLCRTLTPAVFGQAADPIAVAGGGPSLLAGLPGKGEDDMRYFSSRTLPQNY